MRKFLGALASFSIISACSTFSDIESGLSERRGQSVNALISDIGFPSQTLEVAGRKLYIWSTSRSTNSLQPGTGFGGAPTLVVGPAIDYYCTIKVEVDDHDIIQGWELDGNIGGCKRYAQQLR